MEFEHLKSECDRLKSKLDQAVRDKHQLCRSFATELKKGDEVVNVIIPLGMALSAEKNYNVLLHKIMDGARSICHADGGTIYIKEASHLHFKIIENDTLNIHWNEFENSTSTFPSIPIYDDVTGDINDKNVATLAAAEGKTINIVDAYENKDFDFSGTKRFDEANGYRSKSFLTVPLKNHKDEVIGVMQLINAQSPQSGDVLPFSYEKQEVVESLSALAATAMENQMLLQAQKDLLDSFIQLISDAIDQKSPYTGGHCNRVPVITQMLAEAAIEQKEGPFRDFDLNETEMYELKTAAWLHDIGKITTPEHVVDKATKLETIHDRIHVVEERFANLKLQVELELARGSLSEADAKAQQLSLDEDLAFLQHANVGGEFMTDEHKQRVIEMSERKIKNHRGEWVHLLNEDEVHNLCISRGTLTEAERKIINNHISVTIDMLNALPLPNDLKRVPEYAGGHHEKMDGTGYPKGLTKEQMSIPARMMAIADIFEALTASDRPYKKGKKLSEAIRIMNFMRKDHHIDEELFELFIKSGTYEIYAKENLKPEQVDSVNVEEYFPSEEKV
jgi:HD-GYP domain-containing protein (c-di-GMP phosphodiesterase class II)